MTGNGKAATTNGKATSTNSKPAATGALVYSGTPLARKLGFKPGMRLWVDGAPADYFDWLAPLPEGLQCLPEPGPLVDQAHVFTHQRERLAERLTQLREQLRPDTGLWISWPKKASKQPSTVTEDTIRELGLPLGWVDVKVCAVNATWSALKLVVRLELRQEREERARRRLMGGPG